MLLLSNREIAKKVTAGGRNRSTTSPRFKIAMTTTCKASRCNNPAAARSDLRNSWKKLRPISTY